ncbi:MAG: hypothetical protein WKF61_00485 [Luteimonas sp.]
MESPVKRLVRNDRVRHAPAPPTAPDTTGEEGKSGSSSLGYFAGMLDVALDAGDHDQQQKDAIGMAQAVPAPVDVGEDQTPPAAAHARRSALAELVHGQPLAQPPAAAACTDDVEARPEIVDVLTSLCPVFRAAYVFPGPGVPARQMADAVHVMSRQVVSISEALARDCDPLEIDQSWMRARMGTFVSELVSSAWVSTAIHRQRLPLGRQDAAPSPEGEIERLATCVSAAMRAIEGSSYGAAAGSRVAAVVSLAALVFPMEGYRHFITTALPEMEVDLDGATRRMGAAVADEVAAAVARLSAYVPEALHGELASELTAQGAKFIFDARESACGEVFRALDAVREQGGTAEDAIAILNGPEMTGGVPVDRMIALMRAMFGRAVATIEFSAKAMLGGSDGRAAR